MMTPEEYSHALKNYENRLKYLKDHELMLCQFSIALVDTWPFGNKAKPQHLVPSKSGVYASSLRSKQLREMTEGSGKFAKLTLSKQKV
jgi:hypothetical protein